MTRLKICGLRDVVNTIAAADAGADFLGFVFVPGARRQLSVEQARVIIEEYRHKCGSGGPKLVGLFADQALEEVNRAVMYCGLDAVQLCGDESPEYWKGLSARVIKQIRIRDADSVDVATSETMHRVEEVAAGGHLATLDKDIPGSKGGTGSKFDWAIAVEIARCHKFLLAGGLTPSNVRQAVSVVAPWGVDVSSGVETQGVKDSEKIVAFARGVMQADGRVGGSYKSN